MLPRGCGDCEEEEDEEEEDKESSLFFPSKLPLSQVTTRIN